ncbi:DegV family EDD domain-containing protein [Streptococcus sp. zg-86]|uniref:DegV family EDD domain-containing protein n=1 Tax=Streptococcus zhangguiae TaxID=2664091 RepID=A0A6I4RJC1_9STRE|nr:MULTISPECIES: DegV family protein [unclassified Streptococcus]MTB64633.1 DegV family EDD domain-containing protein [Streptococcus sp. zg-86]MTB90943.1 DegV family EDD domain-containing protein [Streptococcus sp. zg-36]MWV56633.1 DegV family EDD domain-containing protein [Streptococcus sp. zg-70]QTH48592.1 DegV family protein [Streptococcus sp. zg-86]
MKLAVITDTSAVLQPVERDDLFVLDIPVTIGETTYVEGKNLSVDEFYQKMASASELPKTSQPSLSDLVEILSRLQKEGYTHVIGLFLSSGISGFYQNIQYLKDEFDGMTIVFPDSKITSAPLGMMVENILKRYELGLSFEDILAKLEQEIAGIAAFIMVDDLDHLVKGGRLSNGAALLGNLLSIKPILSFTDEGKIEVYEKVRTEKKAVKRLLEILLEQTQNGRYQIAIIHANAPQKAEEFKQLLQENGIACELSIVSLGSVIGTHVGEGAIAFGISPIIDEE